MLTILGGSINVTSDLGGRTNKPATIQTYLKPLCSLGKKSPCTARHTTDRK